jgi:hypothetical protein
MGTLAGWAYRKAITVNHTDDGAQTNYQMKLTINHGDGADTTGLVYLNHHALNWPTDIQITASDGTTAVDFWREESDATDGTWWIECPSIAAGETWTGYIYYGDVDATDVSGTLAAGEATFIFFDDFNDSSLDTNKWTNATGVAEGAGTVVLTGGAAQVNLYSKNKVSTSHSACRARLKTGHNASTSYYENYSSLVDGGYQSSFCFCHADATANNRVYSANNGGVNVQKGDLITGDAAATWMICEIQRNGSTSVRFTVDDGNAHTNSTANCIYSVDGYILHGAYLASASGEVDFSLVRNYTLNEPTWAASGAEEALGGSTLIRSVPRVARIMLMSP